MPDKQFFKIREASRHTGVEPYVLRYWESEFPILRPTKSRGGHRVYSQHDLDVILRIKAMLYEQGLKIRAARRRLQRKASSQDVSERLRQVSKEVGQILKVLSEESPLTEAGRSATR